MNRIIPRGFFRTRPNKYNARKVEVDGHKFDSAREARRYGALRVFERDGLIRDLRLQPSFPLVVNARRIGRMTLDFDYEEKGEDGEWRRVLEDVKSEATRQNTAYRLRLRLLRALYPDLDIREVC